MPLRGEAAGRPTYQIQAVVPTGAGRYVYLAHHNIFNGPCMQKSVSLVGLPDAMFLSEPQLIEKLEHPHIVKIREAQYDPGDASMVTYVMPCYAGGSVHKQLVDKGTRFSVAQSVALGGHLLDALAYLHTGIGFIHRDVKADNLLLDGTLTSGYLSDFGSAARIGPTGTVALANVTLPYVDPRAATAGVMTMQSDVYSAGMTLFETLAGSLVPKLDAPTAQARLAAGKRAYPDSAFRYPPHVSDPLRRVVNKAMHVDLSLRYGSAADMATALAKAGRRVVDWHHAAGDGLEGEWYGTWPTTKPVTRRRRYRITSTPASQAGSRRGQLRVRADYWTDNRWRGFGGLDEYVGAGDHAAAFKFFESVARSIAQNRAAQ